MSCMGGLPLALCRNHGCHLYRSTLYVKQVHRCVAFMEPYIEFYRELARCNRINRHNRIIIAKESMASYATVAAKSTKGAPPPCTSRLDRVGHEARVPKVNKAEVIDESAGNRGRDGDRAGGDGDDQLVVPQRRSTSARRWNKPPAPDASPPESTPESAGPMPLAIVSYGYEMHIAQTIDSYLQHRGNVFIDVAKLLKRIP